MLIDMDLHHIVEGVTPVNSFLLVDDVFALKQWLVKSYGRRQLTSEERIANYRIFRGRRVVENAFGILAGRVLLGTMEQQHAQDTKTTPGTHPTGKPSSQSK